MPALFLRTSAYSALESPQQILCRTLLLIGARIEQLAKEIIRMDSMSAVDND